MTTLRRRLDAVAAKHRPPAGQRSHSDQHSATEKLARFKAAMVAYYLGAWRPGLDAYECLKAGVASVNSPGAQPSLLHAACAAERAFSGRLGSWHTAERLRAAFVGIGQARGQLITELGDVLSRADEIGDATLTAIARKAA